MVMKMVPFGELLAILAATLTDLPNQQDCDRPRLGERSQCRGSGERLIEIGRQERKVQRIGEAVVVEIALRPDLAAARAEIGGECVEVQSVHSAVEIRVADAGVLNQQAGV